VTISVFELFKVGIGPSSSHTVGPMRAAADFVAQLEAIGVLARVVDVRVEMYGSLAATGRGHGTLPAVLLGLEGHRPETIESEEMESGRERLRSTGKILLGGRVPIALSEDDIALYTRTVLDFHPNGMTMIATAADDTMLYRQTYFSVGGGFVVTEEEAAGADSVTAGEGDTSFSSAAQLLALASGTGRTISEVMLVHECRTRSAEQVRAGLLASARRHGRVRAARHQPHRAVAPSPGWFRSRASNATRYPRERPSMLRAWRYAATAPTASASTKSSPPCARPDAT
jgi:L-serine dehydratase